MTWQFQTDRPIYTQLIEQITLAVVSGRYSPGERLPSVRDMSAEAGVNPNTMQRALSEMERQGLLYSQRTSGRFITKDTDMINEAKTLLAKEQVSAFLTAMERQGYLKEQILQLVKQAVESGGENK